MGEIYSRAQEVIAWLGPAAEDSDLAVDWIVQFGTRSYNLGIGMTPELRLRHLLSRFEDNKALPSDDLTSFLRELNAQLFTTDPTSSMRLCEALSKILKRPYWGRIWVVQEVVSARTIIFMCGKARITETAMHHALRLLRNFRHYVTTMRVSLNVRQPVMEPSIIHVDTQDPINLLKTRRAAASLPLIHLLRTHRKFYASDPRDKVFALLGLASDAETLGIRVDYHQTFEQVFTAVAEKLLLNGFVEVLSLTDSETSQHALPSWVPDWPHDNRRMPLQQRGLDRSARIHTSCLQPPYAAGRTNAASHIKFKPIEITAPLLGVKGRLIGEILDVGAVWKAGGVSQWLDDLERLSYQVYIDLGASDQRLHALYRTSVADQQIRDGSSKPRLSEVKLQKILQYLASKDLKSMEIDHLIEDGLGHYYQQLHDIAISRRPLLVSGKYMGIGPSEAEAGDIIYTLYGSDVPHLFRSIPGNSRCFQLIGEVYIHGAMDHTWDDKAFMNTITVL
ncbi:hypothetical protein CC78DRAFT_549686 [Lojkania enalia]|uniref:Heterokaryon incompatibility domain-containing protein n=1 Tax=Lojkania enalia TaxID=147567 RepID=A0A9P4JWJ4_9PLEO|nr:hypothetical protein CC78DRAFT_549686 [Didymosphaeria enalia]